MSRFAIQQVRFNNVLYPGVAGYSYDPANDINGDSLDSTTHETAHHGLRVAPSAELTTRNLGFLAALDGSTDIWHKALDGTNGLELIGGKANANGPDYASGSVHTSRKGLRGSLLGTSLSWSKGGKAELGLRAMFISADGTTAAVASSLIALPAAPAPDFGWILSALTLSGDAVSSVESASITCDAKAAHDYMAGLPEPTDINMAGVNGPASWRLAASVGDCHLGSGAGACSAVFRRLATGGGFSVAANSTLTITFNSNWSIEEGLSGQSGSPMARSLVVRPRYNGTTKPVTWAFS